MASIDLFPDSDCGGMLGVELAFGRIVSLRNSYSTPNFMGRSRDLLVHLGVEEFLRGESIVMTLLN